MTKNRISRSRELNSLATRQGASHSWGFALPAQSVTNPQTPNERPDTSDSPARRGSPSFDARWHRTRRFSLVVRPLLQQTGEKAPNWAVPVNWNGPLFRAQAACGQPESTILTEGERLVEERGRSESDNDLIFLPPCFCQSSHWACSCTVWMADESHPGRTPAAFGSRRQPGNVHSAALTL